MRNALITSGLGLLFALGAHLTGPGELLVAAGVALACVTSLGMGVVATRLSQVSPGYHQVLRAVACLLPQPVGQEWARSMQRRLARLAGTERRSMLADIVSGAPILWVTAWTVHRRRCRTLRAHGATLVLVARLRVALVPSTYGSPAPVEAQESFMMLRSLGLGRTLHWPAHMVPALQLARRLLDMHTNGLHPARTAARHLLHTRDRAHRIVRELRRTRQPTEDLRYHRNIARLRAQAIGHAVELRRQLDLFIQNDHKPRRRDHTSPWPAHQHAGGRSINGFLLR